MLTNTTPSTPNELQPPSSQEQGKLPSIPRPTPLSLEEVQKLLTDPRVTPDRRVFYALSVLTGARFSEVAALRWGHCNFDDGAPDDEYNLARVEIRPELKGRAYKYRSPRLIPMHPALRQVLLKWRDEGWQAACGRPPTHEDLVVPRVGLPATMRRPDSERLHWHRNLETLCIPKRSMHSQRYAFAHLCQEAGMPLEVTFAMLGRAVPKSYPGDHESPRWVTRCKYMRMIPLVLPSASI